MFTDLDDTTLAPIAPEPEPGLPPAPPANDPVGFRNGQAAPLAPNEVSADRMQPPEPKRARVDDVSAPLSPSPPPPPPSSIPRVARSPTPPPPPAPPRVVAEEAHAYVLGPSSTLEELVLHDVRLESVGKTIGLDGVKLQLAGELGWQRESIVPTKAFFSTDLGASAHIWCGYMRVCSD